MSGSYMEEPMDYQDQATSQSQVHPIEEVQLTLSLKWLDSQKPEKFYKNVQTLLQTWFNKCKIVTDCSVVNTFGTEQVVIQLKPAPGVAQLQKLLGHTLKFKTNAAAATISRICLTPPSALGEEDAAMSLSETQLQYQEPPGAEGRPGAVMDSVSPPKENEPFGIVSVSQYWYLTQVHMDKITEITERNGVEMVENMKVLFKAVKKDGNPQKALSEFTSFIQSLQICPSVVPLKFVDPDKWNEVLQFAKDEDKELLLNLTSENVIVFGPTDSCEAVGKLLNAEPETHAPIPASEYEKAPQDASLTITMTISDPFSEAGLTIEESTWKLMKTSFIGKIEQIKYKFNVCLKEVYADKGKVIVRASSMRAGGNDAMESHAIRALLRLYQKIVTSPMNSSWSLMKSRSGDDGDDESDNSWVDCVSPGGCEAAAGSEAASGAAGVQEDECPICRDAYTDKTQLRCKHEFCKECLRKTRETMGPVCPVCREVFGTIEGDQPVGTMTTSTISVPLPGFRGCDTLQILYEIPDGIQTSKHPNPGHRYRGVRRLAFLPDNIEGREVLRLLTKAFNQKLIFTIGTSRTTGEENSVTWNDIHHKTSTTGGPQSFGYPDPHYLTRVKEELKAKGIK